MEESKQKPVFLQIKGSEDKNGSRQLPLTALLQIITSLPVAKENHKH